MTHAQQPEYIITENQLDILERVSVSGYSNVFRNIRSRPHLPEPSQPARLACIIDIHAYQHGNTLFEDIRVCSGESCNYCGRFNKDIETVIARAATLAAYDKIIEAIDNTPGTIITDDGSIKPKHCWTPKQIKAIIDILRQSTTGDEPLP